MSIYIDMWLHKVHVPLIISPIGEPFYTLTNTNFSHFHAHTLSIHTPKLISNNIENKNKSTGLLLSLEIGILLILIARYYSSGIYLNGEKNNDCI